MYPESWTHYLSPMNYRICTRSLLLSTFRRRKKKVGTLVIPNVTDLVLFVFRIQFFIRLHVHSFFTSQYPPLAVPCLISLVSARNSRMYRSTVRGETDNAFATAAAEVLLFSEMNWMIVSFTSRSLSVVSPTLSPTSPAFSPTSSAFSPTFVYSLFPLFALLYYNDCLTKTYSCARSICVFTPRYLAHTSGFVGLLLISRSIMPINLFSLCSSQQSSLIPR